MLTTGDVHERSVGMWVFVNEGGALSSHLPVERFLPSMKPPTTNTSTVAVRENFSRSFNSDGI